MRRVDVCLLMVDNSETISSLLYSWLDHGRSITVKHGQHSHQLHYQALMAHSTHAPLAFSRAIPISVRRPTSRASTYVSTMHVSQERYKHVYWKGVSLFLTANSQG